MGTPSLRKLLWVSTSCLQKWSFKLLPKQLSQTSLLTFVNSRLNTVFSTSYTPPLIALTSQITRVSPKTSIWYTVYTVGFLLAFLFRAPFSGLIFFLLPSQPVDIFRGALLTHPFFILSIFTLLLTSFTHMVSPQAGTNNPQILLFCTSEPCYLSLGSQILQY